jgi:hypothetical protein
MVPEYGGISCSSKNGVAEKWGGMLSIEVCASKSSMRRKQQLAIIKKLILKEGIFSFHNC